MQDPRLTEKPGQVHDDGPVWPLLLILLALCLSVPIAMALLRGGL